MRTLRQRLWMAAASLRGLLILQTVLVIAAAILFLCCVPDGTDLWGLSVILPLHALLIFGHLLARSKLRLHLKQHDDALCPQCWYELVDEQAVRCPECGARMTREAAQTYWIVWLNRGYAH